VHIPYLLKVENKLVFPGALPVLAEAYQRNQGGGGRPHRVWALEAGPDFNNKTLISPTLTVFNATRWHYPRHPSA
jgi:hypothetical protein